MVMPENSPFREWCFKIANHRYFDIGILIAILFNSLCLCVKWPNMSSKAESTLETINYFFTLIFFIEMIVKLLGFGKRYFRDNWNRFDFLVVMTSVTFIIIA